MRKAIVWIIVVVVIFLVGFRIYQARQRVKLQIVSEETAVKTVAVIEPTIGDISYTLSFVGNIKGEDQVQVFSEVPGKLLRYTVSEGTKVHKDSSIALVDRAITGMKFEPVRVKSPISGIVGKLFLDQGSTVAPQIPVAMVVRMDRVKAVFNVGEKDLAKVRKGTTAKIRVDTYPEEVFRGKVTRISPVIDPMSRSANCEATISNPRHRLKPGMFAEVDLIVETHKSTILLPREAAIQDLEKGIFYLFIVEDGKAIKKEIEVGLTSKDSIEIKTGVNQGDKVIIKGQHYLEGGEEVEIVK
jgi:membrane fusion protein (multidrug efflux system)